MRAPAIQAVMKQAIVPKIGLIGSFSHSVHENEMFAEKPKGKIEGS